MNRLITFLILTLALSFSVSAELIVNTHTNDFTLQSPNNEQLKLCSCETKVDTLYIENTGEFYGNYALHFESAYPGKIRLSETHFQLAPHHTKEVLVYIEDSCGITGTFDYVITAVNSYGRVEQLSRTIRSDMCQIGHLEVTPGEQTVGTCQQATFQVTAKNVGTFSESFKLDFGAYNGVAALGAKELYLKPDQSYTQDVVFTLPCTDYGTFTIPFSLASAHQGTLTGTQRQLTVTNDYDVTIDVATTLNACAQTTAHVPVTITNNAGIPDEITLAIDGPAYVTFENGARTMTLGLAPNTSIDVQLAIAAGKADIGTHPITLTLTDRYGGIEKQRTAELDINNCYEPALEIRTTPTGDAISGDRDCCGTKTYTVAVVNMGDREQVLNLALDGPSLFTLDQTSVRVRPSESVNVALYANLPCTDETYTVKVIVSPEGQAGITTTKELTITSLSERACYAIAIDDDELRIREDATLVPVIVASTGLRAGNYTIETDSSLYGISQEIVELQPGEKKALHLVPKGDLTTQEKGRALVLPTLTHENTGIVYNEAIGVTLRGPNVFERFMNWLFGLSLTGWSVCARIVIALFLLLVVLIIMLLAVYAGKLALSDGLSRRTLLWLKVAILVLIAILLIMLAFAKAPARASTYESVAIGANGTTIEWYQNERFALDLNIYFEDPDQDTLTFSASQPENVNVAFDGSIMTLTPDHNFAGEDTMVITASDSKGATTDSPIFTLRVIPKKDLTFAQWLSAWCTHLSILALIGILIVLFFMTLTVKQRRDDLTRDNVIVVVPAPAKKRVAKKKTAKKAATRRVAKKSAKKRVAKKKASKKSARTAKPASRALARTQPGMIVVQPTTKMSQPIRETREGQTVNIAVGQPLPVPGAKPSEILLVASTTGNTVHTPYCMIARRIPKNKRIAFGMKQEALRNGLVPCKGCRPF